MEFYLSDGSAVVNDMQTVNSAAKSAYNLLAEMMADGETRDMTPEQVFEQGMFEKANSPYGLATGLNISPTAEGDKYMNELMMYGYSHIAVYVGLTGYSSNSRLRFLCHNFFPRFFLSCSLRRFFSSISFPM